VCGGGAAAPAARCTTPIKDFLFGAFLQTTADAVAAPEAAPAVAGPDAAAAAAAADAAPAGGDDATAASGPEAPAADEAFRASLDAVPSPELHARLTATDAPAAARLHPNDRRRIVRALEIAHTTGERATERRTAWNDAGIAPRRSDLFAVILDWPVEAINRRINARVRRMFEAGFVDEVSALAARGIGRVCDGDAEVRRAAREQMRQGADQIKIMMSGGVASPYDPLTSLQFSMEEARAAVEEAHAFGRYVCAHAYTPEAITRAAHAGVRTIEHGNLIDEPAAKLMAEKGMFLIANLVAYYAMKERAAEFGMSAEMLEKNDMVIDGALKSLEICKRAGVPVGYGSDLLGQLQVDQSREFLLRSEVLSPIDIIRSATTVGAQIVRMEGKLGTIKAGAFADLLLVNGNPLKNLGLMQNQGRDLSMIMKAGRFHKNTLTH
jgi:hypothetical protein